MEYPLFRSLHLNEDNEYGILHSSYQYYYLLGCLISIRYSILYTQHSTLAKIDARYLKTTRVFLAKGRVAPLVAEH